MLNNYCIKVTLKDTLGIVLVVNVNSPAAIGLPDAGRLKPLLIPGAFWFPDLEKVTPLLVALILKFPVEITSIGIYCLRELLLQE
jgi:hypothetical protein